MFLKLKNTCCKLSFNLIDTLLSCLISKTKNNQGGVSCRCVEYRKARVNDMINIKEPKNFKIEVLKIKVSDPNINHKRRNIDLNSHNERFKYLN